LEARIINWTLPRKPADGSTHWSSRKLAAALGLSHMRVARVWTKVGLQPSRRRHDMASDDPDFESKAAAIIGLYLKPPTHAAVFCVDEKTAIQALDQGPQQKRQTLQVDLSTYRPSYPLRPSASCVTLH
jgi:hypothetical protein